MKDINYLTKKIYEETDSRVIVDVERFDSEDCSIQFREEYEDFEVMLPIEEARKYLEGVLFGLELSEPLEKRQEKHEEVCDNTDHVGDIAPNVKEVEMKEEFDGEKVRWCKDCRERDENMIKN